MNFLLKYRPIFLLVLLVTISGVFYYVAFLDSNDVIEIEHESAATVQAEKIKEEDDYNEICNVTFPSYMLSDVELLTEERRALFISELEKFSSVVAVNEFGSLCSKKNLDVYCLPNISVNFNHDYFSREDAEVKVPQIISAIGGISDNVMRNPLFSSMYPLQSDDASTTAIYYLNIDKIDSFAFLWEVENEVKDNFTPLQLELEDAYNRSFHVSITSNIPAQREIYLNVKQGLFREEVFPWLKEKFDNPDYMLREISRGFDECLVHNSYSPMIDPAD